MLQTYCLQLLLLLLFELLCIACYVSVIIMCFKISVFNQALVGQVIFQTTFNDFFELKTRPSIFCVKTHYLQYDSVTV